MWSSYSQHEVCLSSPSTDPEAEHRLTSLLLDLLEQLCQRAMNSWNYWLLCMYFLIVCLYFLIVLFVYLAVLSLSLVRDWSHPAPYVSCPVSDQLPPLVHPLLLILQLKPGWGTSEEPTPLKERYRGGNNVNVVHCHHEVCPPTPPSGHPPPPLHSSVSWSHNELVHENRGHNSIVK